MACLRLTLIEPRLGAEEEMQSLLAALDARLAQTPGLIFSFVTRVELHRVGRIALWQSKEAANRVAMRDDVLALRARIRSLAVATEEALMELSSGYLPGPLRTLLEGSPQMTPVPVDMEAVA